MDTPETITQRPNKLKRPKAKKRKLKIKVTADDSEARSVRMTKVRPRPVLLQFRHIVNGISYGPGLIQLRNDIASALEAQEVMMAREEAKLRTPRAGIITGPGGRHIRVPYDHFDAAYAAAQPFSQIKEG